jgi:hypothetical protein
LFSGAGRTLLVAFAIACASCNDDPPASPDQPPPQPPVAAGAAIRAAQLTEEAGPVDVAWNGVVRIHGLRYPGVSAYVAVSPGDYRIQFLSEGQGSPALAEMTLSIPSASAYTVAIVGIDETRAVAFLDEPSTNPDRSGVRLYNAVPDYPSSFDLAVINGDVLHRNVSYLEITSVALVIPGFYDFELRRSPYTEVVAEALGKGLDRGANFTVFATGTLRRDDVELILARDATF